MPQILRFGFSLVGLLITMVCIVVLFAILMNSLNTAVTGQGSQRDNTVRSVKDKVYLTGLFQSMAAASLEKNGDFITPHKVAQSNDVSLNTTANLFAAMLTENYTTPEQLISGNEYSPYVRPKTNFNYYAYNPAQKSYWDTTFVADLEKDSNVSFAHMPLSGKRFERKWQATMDSTFPLFGNRGPKDGVNSNAQYSVGRDGVWRGHVVFGDGHVEFTESPTFSFLLTSTDGGNFADNIFKMETGGKGSDAILSFTKSMKTDNPELQFD